jgi:hypothetical protein
MKRTFDMSTNVEGVSGDQVGRVFGGYLQNRGIIESSQSLLFLLSSLSKSDRRSMCLECALLMQVRFASKG